MISSSGVKANTEARSQWYPGSFEQVLSHKTITASQSDAMLTLHLPTAAVKPLGAGFGKSVGGRLPTPLCSCLAGPGSK